MARRRTATAPVTDGETPILPRELVTFDGSGGREYRQHWQQRNRWYAEHGIDPGDWPKIYAVLRASWKAHGIETARDRLRIGDVA